MIAFDSDLASLKATKRMTSLIDRQRLRLVYGFVSNRHLSGRNLSEAKHHTLRSIEASGVTGDVGTTRYVCLDSNPAVEIPSNTLDGLLLNESTVRAPILVKCDIEGAEQLTLEGAQQWLSATSPTLRLSVHPWALPVHGNSKESLMELLDSLGYEVTMLGVDHEEHWWCERQQ